MLYDSLKELKKENQYDKKMGSLGAVRLWAMAISAIVGGLAFKYYPGLPYLLSGILSFLGFVACFYL